MKAANAVAKADADDVNSKRIQDGKRPLKAARPQAVMHHDR